MQLQGFVTHCEMSGNFSFCPPNTVLWKQRLNRSDPAVFSPNTLPGKRKTKFTSSCVTEEPIHRHLSAWTFSFFLHLYFPWYHFCHVLSVTTKQNLLHLLFLSSPPHLCHQLHLSSYCYLALIYEFSRFLDFFWPVSFYFYILSFFLLILCQRDPNQRGGEKLQLTVMTMLTRLPQSHFIVKVSPTLPSCTKREVQVVTWGTLPPSTWPLQRCTPPLSAPHLSVPRSSWRFARVPFPPAIMDLKLDLTTNTKRSF